MPLTPRFDLSQNDLEITVIISVPLIRIDSMEVLLDEDSVLHVYAHPYSLTLNFAPHEFDHVSHQQGTSAQYDPAKQTIRMSLVKAVVGEIWPNLDMVGRLLKPKEIPKQWLHAVTSNDEIGDNDDTNIHDSNENEEYQVNKTGLLLNCNKTGYGFGNLFQNIFTDYCRSGLAEEMLSLQDPEHTPLDRRRELREVSELQAFDPDRYDFYISDDYLYPMVMEFIPFWRKYCDPKSPRKNQNKAADSLSQEMQQKLTLSGFTSPKTSRSIGAAIHSSISPFTSDEQLLMSTIPYPLIPTSFFNLDDENMQDQLWLGLLDLLVPYVYDHVTTLGDPTVESAWTITTLSSSLSWLDPPMTAKEALVSLTRRMLIYPYWRNIEFSLKVWEHVIFILEREELYTIVKCLLQTRSILEKSEFYYAGNKLFIDPYLCWIQRQEPNNKGAQILAVRLKKELKHGTLKDDVDLDISVYERLALGEEESSSVEEDTESYDEHESSDSDSSYFESDSENEDDTKDRYTHGASNATSCDLLQSEEAGENPSGRIFSIVGSHSSPTKSSNNGQRGIMMEETCLIQEIGN